MLTWVSAIEDGVPTRLLRPNMKEHTKSDSASYPVEGQYIYTYDSFEHSGGLSDNLIGLLQHYPIYCLFLEDNIADNFELTLLVN